MKPFIIFTILVVSIFADRSLLLKEFADGNVKYIGSLYKELSKSNSGNFLVCPLSIQLVFALLNSGAKGNTAKEIASALHLPEGEEKVEEVFTELAKALQVNDQYTFSAANKIFVADHFKVKEPYKKTAVDVFHSDIQNVNFGEAAKTVREINEWVEEKTHNKIHELITEDMIDGNTVAVLINALYFQGNWSSEFENVFEAPFRLTEEKSVLTNLMNVYGRYNYFYCPLLKMKLLELPYKGDQITMTIVLPDKISGLPDLEERVAEILEHADYQEAIVNVTIPEFKIESTNELVQPLTNLGIVDAFTGAADFSDVSEDGEKLTVSDVVQKAFIDVNREGTTASAATAVVVGRSGRQHDEFEFVADHPFIFFLKHKVNGVFFIGRYVEV